MARLKRQRWDCAEGFRKTDPSEANLPNQAFLEECQKKGKHFLGRKRTAVESTTSLSFSLLLQIKCQLHVNITSESLHDKHHLL